MNKNIAIIFGLIFSFAASPVHAIGMKEETGRGQYDGSIANRSIQSGGDIGGKKKEGTISKPKWPSGSGKTYKKSK